MSRQECDVCEQICYHPQAICLAKQEMLAPATVQKLADLFKICGDPTRIRILHALSRREMCVCDLAEVVNMGQSAISHQLRLLRGARLVKYRKEGKEAWYSLDDAHIVTLLCQGLEHIEHT